MVSRLKDAAYDIGAAQIDRVRDVFTLRLDRTCERLSRVSGPVRDLGLNPARKLTEFYCPLDSIRAVSLGFLDKTEAILDSLDSLAAERDLAEHLARRLDCTAVVDCGKSEDNYDETSSCTSRSTWSWVDSVPRVLSTHAIRTFGVQLSKSATLKVTGICLQDTCAAVMRRLRVADAQKLLDRLVFDDVKEQLMSAARDRSPAAAVTVAARVAYLGCERLLGDSIATRLLARATGKIGSSAGLPDCVVGEDIVLQMLDDPETVGSSAREHAAAGATVEREIRQGDPVEFRLIVKNSFIELDETPGDLRRARSWPDESWDTMRTQTLRGLTSGPFTLVGTWEPLPSNMPPLGPADSTAGSSSSREIPGQGSTTEGLTAAQACQSTQTSRASQVERDVRAFPPVAADNASSSTASAAPGLTSDAVDIVATQVSSQPMEQVCQAQQGLSPRQLSCASSPRTAGAQHELCQAQQGLSPRQISCASSPRTAAPGRSLGSCQSSTTGLRSPDAKAEAGRHSGRRQELSMAIEELEQQKLAFEAEALANTPENGEVGSAGAVGPQATESSVLTEKHSPPGLEETEESIFDSEENRTTVMLRNIPREYSPAMVLELMDNAGFSRRYNFFYLPVDFTRGMVLGYALVCCRSPVDAASLLERFQGFRHWAVPSSCICEASWSQPRQSLRDHIERYRSSPVMHPSVPDEYKPALFVDGKRVPFPAPTKAIRRPRIRHLRKTD